MSTQDYYSILGVPRDATTQEIKRAFRQVARECHPDVSGGDPAAEERFKAARQAYETLMDPVTRARYDRRGKRRQFTGGSFFDAFYKATGEAEQQTDGPGSMGARRATGPSYGNSAAGGYAGQKRKRYDPGNDLDLDDLFNDFGDFGFGGRTKTHGSKGARFAQRVRSAPPPPRSPGPTTPQPGADVHLELDVPAGVAREGGAVTAVYYRMQRADSWRPGSSDPGVVRVQDIADVRIIPGTRDGEVLRERGLGDAGAHGGPYGDLVVRVCLVQDRRSSRPDPRREAPEPDPGPRVRTRTRDDSPPPPREPPPPPPPSPSAETETSTSSSPSPTLVTLDISVVEALLGGRVQLKTPQGNVRLSVPPGTSSGTRLRLKGKGPEGPDGPGDLYVQIRIVVPKRLDEESRQLIERFAELNPDDPR